MAQAPSLVSSDPPNGATGVPVSAAIRFTFSVPMFDIDALSGMPGFFVGAIEWEGGGVDPMKFTYTWSNNNTTVTCDYSGNLPANTQIT